jgi:dienelactone hydrolase
MFRLKRVLLLLSCVAWCFPTHAAGSEVWGDLSKGPHGVGFRLLQDIDPTRSFQGKARPMRIYLWYPADKATRPAMRFRDYADLAALDFGGDRRIRIGAERIDPSLPIITSFSEQGLAQLMDEELLAIRDAPPGKGRFPLIVFGQGLDFESPLTHVVMCEYLASHGYVVVTVPLLGAHSRLSGVEVIDVEAHTRDMEFALGRARGLPFVDGARLGVMGFDLGGIAALLLAMRNAEIEALSTLDCAVQFDNEFLKVPHESPDFDPDRLRAAWIHIMQERYVRPDLPDLESRSLFAQARYSDAYFIWVDDVEHANFTSYAMLDLEKPLRGRRPFKDNARPAYEMVCRYVQSFFDAYLQSDPGAMAFLHKEPQENAPAGVTFSVRSHDASPAPPTMDDLINCLFEKGLDETLDLAKSAPVAETILNATAYKILRWGDSEWAIALFELNAELYPQSANVYDSLGDAYVEKGAIELAIRNYKKALALDPEAEHTKSKLDRLEKETVKR